MISTPLSSFGRRTAAQAGRPAPRSGLRLLLLLLALAGPLAPGAAAEPGPGISTPAAPTSLEALSAKVEKADLDLHALSKSFGETDLTQSEFTSRLSVVGPIQASLSEALAQLSPRLSAVDARLAQLGPPPGPGQPPEAAQIAQTRRALTRIRQKIDGEVKQANLLQVEAGQIASMLADRRREQLEAQLWVHSRSPLDPYLWRQCAEALPGDVARLRTIWSDEADALAKAARSRAVVGGWVVTLLAAGLLVGPLRLLADRLMMARFSRLEPRSRLRRTLLALCRVLAAAGAPLAALLLAREVLAGSGAMTPVFEQLTPILIRAVVFAGFFEGLGSALLMARAPSWRLAPIPDAMVKRLRPYPGIIGVTAALASLVRGMNTVLGSSQPTAIASDCLTVIVELVAVGAALSMLGHARNAHLASAVEHTTPREAESRLPWIIAALLAWLTLAGSLAAVLVGYVEMSAFLMGRMIWFATVLGSLFLLLRFIDDLIPVVLSPDRSIGRFLRMAIGLSERGLDQTAVLLSGVLRLGIFLAAWAAILAPFGAGAGDLFGRVTSSQLVLRIGQASISPGALAGALVVFVVGLFLTRVVRSWLERSYLPKTQLDVGLRTSLAAGVTYLGGLLAVLLTFGYLGLSFDRIALFASALSVGVGFGLQAVIGNFVSGLILLAERPVKVGDWIAIGDLEGDVKRINVRATEIEMQDRSKLIVPNSDLISKTVRNVTHSGSLGRLKIVLKTVDDADPDLVRGLIMARLAAHPGVREEPPAAVYLTNVADGALEFTAFAYVDSPRLAYRTRSELLFQIVPDLRAKGVALARSSTIVNVALADRPMEPTV